jgi:hypothetical protein
MRRVIRVKESARRFAQNRTHSCARRARAPGEKVESPVFRKTGATTKKLELQAMLIYCLRL